MEQAHKGRTLGLTGTIIGFIALTVAVLHFFMGPIEAPPPIEETIADMAVNLKGEMISRIKGEDDIHRERDNSRSPDQLVNYAVIVAGLLALALGVAGFVRGEPVRANIAATGLGMGAIVFEYSIMVISAILVLLMIGYLLRYFDLSW